MEFRIWNKLGVEKVYKLIVVVAGAVLMLGAVLVLLPYRLNSFGSVEFVIKDGQSLGTTARLLAERDLILSRYLFVGYAVLAGQEKEFKAGRYILNTPVSINGLVRIFSNGQSESDDIVVVIPEGTNVADIDKIFVKAGLTKGGDILGYNLKHGNTFVQEGFLFPDTYRFKFPEAGQLVPVEEIIKKTKDNFKLKTKNVLAGSSIGDGMAGGDYRIIIIASILEKEVRTEEDMRLVAGIIEKRLALGMALELDATVAYGVCQQKFLLGEYCDVALANIVDNIPIDSVYNTYKRRGLPVGPISNPGLRALRAVLNPQPSDYLFYLSAQDGTTIFSKTATEHLRARQKYLSK